MVGRRVLLRSVTLRSTSRILQNCNHPVDHDVDRGSRRKIDCLVWVFYPSVTTQIAPNDLIICVAFATCAKRRAVIIYVGIYSLSLINRKVTLRMVLGNIRRKPLELQ